MRGARYEEPQDTGLGSEVLHGFQGGCCSLQCHYYNAKLPVYFSPRFRSGVGVLGPSTGVGQAWECGSRGCVGCPEHVTEEKQRADGQWGWPGTLHYQQAIIKAPTCCLKAVQGGPHLSISEWIVCE